MSQPTMTQALARAREQLDESTAAAWQDSELRRWLMEGANDVARRTRCLRGSTTVTTTAGESDYPLTTRLVQITHAEYLASGWVQRRPLTYVDLPTHSSFGYSPNVYPTCYTTWGEPPWMTLRLHPAPANDDEVVYLYYYRLPETIAYAGGGDSTVIEIPEGWDDLLYLYAEAMAMRRDRNMDMFTSAYQLYEQKLAELNNVALRFNDQPGQIVDDWTMSDYMFGPYGRGR